MIVDRFVSSAVILVSAYFGYNEVPKKQDFVIPIKTVEVKPTLVSFNDLAGKKASPIIRAYIGSDAIVPDSGHVNFDKQLRYLWDRKLKISGVTPATRKNADKIISRYIFEDKGKMKLNDFIKEADDDISSARSSLNLSAFCHKMRLDGKKCYNLRRMTDKIDGKVLTAYSMTEVFPYRNGKDSKKVLSFLLENAGKSYINSIPALGDKYFSFGAYQFTSYAVRHDTKVEGASVVNLFVDKKDKIPGSVMQLGNEYQHKAAFYFATYNLARLCQHLSVKDQEQFLKEGKEEIVKFIAISHHMPTLAIRQTKAWINSGAKGELDDNLTPSLTIYAKKTESNYHAL